jgi:hypothetical protein
MFESQCCDIGCDIAAELQADAGVEEETVCLESIEYTLQRLCDHNN